MTGAAAIKGRDGRLVPARRVAPVHDSIVISSHGIGAITLAARLAREPVFAGRVTVAAKPVTETRQLIDGCTLRARSIDYYAAASGSSRDDIVARVYGQRAHAAETHRQMAGVARPHGNGVAFARVEPWMRNQGVKRDRTEGAPLAYGVRNSRLMAVLNEKAAQCGVRFDSSGAATYDELRALSDGKNPLVVNGTPKPIKGATWLHQPAAPKHFVAAAQMAFTAPQLETRGVLQRHDSFVGFIHRDGAIDMSVYYPFQDPLSPRAEYYGIFYRFVRDGSEARREAHQRALRAELEAVGEALGLQPDDPDETAAVAWVPASSWAFTRNRQHGVLDLSRISGAGAPIITGDGMTRAGLGAMAAAEALIEGGDPAEAMNRALTLYRRLNMVQAGGMAWTPGLSAWTLERAPRLAMLGPGKSRDWDMWAGAW
ncbi:hypothetical protein [uncultured Parvibaculum sp.]|uniref:hypothetical protein n=1 Tax=uncultured Parvibaculum sp. TaxID=291828 RepID=UPI0030DAB473|tara:strand:+ start:48610 stop:49893 length:1284 start_codon:yes stop_codon:yes gene_type:complete